MVLITRNALENLDTDILVIPVMSDFSLDNHQHRSFKKKVESVLDITKNQNGLINKNLRLGDFHHYPLDEPSLTWKSLYYLVIQSFIERPTFRSISFSLKEVFLDSLEKGYTSIGVPFLSLGFFEKSIDAAILIDSIKRAYKENEDLKKLKILIPYTPDMKEFLLEELKTLPPELYDTTIKKNYNRYYSPKKK